MDEKFFKICHFVTSHPRGERLMFLPSTFFFIYFYWLVWALKVAGTVVHLVFVGLRDEEGYGAPAGGCRANVR